MKKNNKIIFRHALLFFLFWKLFWNLIKYANSIKRSANRLLTEIYAKKIINLASTFYFFHFIILR